MSAAPNACVVETRGEARANVITHGLGAMAAIAAAAVLLTLAAVGGSPRTITTLAIFGATLVLAFGISAGYHLAGPLRRRTHAILRRLDHSAIYLLIAGTYTPVMLVCLGGGWGWSIAGVVWALSLTGLVLTNACFHRFGWTQLGLKLLLGWLVVVAAVPLVASMSTAGLVLLIAGGLAYTAGVPFFVWERLRYNHAIWHAFVLAGAACHTALMFTDVV